MLSQTRILDTDVSVSETMNIPVIFIWDSPKDLKSDTLFLYTSQDED